MRAAVRFQGDVPPPPFRPDLPSFYPASASPVCVGETQKQQQVRRRRAPGREIRKNHNEFFLSRVVHRYKAGRHTGINKSDLFLVASKTPLRPAGGYTLHLREENRGKFHQCVSALVHQGTNPFTVGITKTREDNGSESGVLAPEAFWVGERDARGRWARS